MTEDARFEDGAERPLRLRAETAEDLAVISALVQDAVGQTSEIAWMPRHRRFTLLLNRFRWEDSARARRQNRPFERVRCLLTIESATRVRAMGVDPQDRDLVISLLSLGFEPGPEGNGVLRAVLAGDGEIALDVECLEVTLTDVTRPHLAMAGAAPRHSPD
ncbi:MAG TPA: DUF2948 family protein [Amaricoccus sp.]|uniref:DUF2948 family protein n=1 Tax=Amaricoccus sp. TaxID=1872485 RepID=UPI002D055862|nr:DUF2948 family protein [Amaricoccus sp.]HMQ93098.1 DUF2948 family protein [Amaricoccus sp.]HMR53885.1 DUF2948 family protein [Amaricoccus sp.]HMU00910.1 DUF2948 family protein [Amaricoccus sp.]